MIRAVLHPLVCLILIAVLGVTGQARAQSALGIALAAGGARIVVCGALGPQTVTLDVRGKPLADPPLCRICPDCMMPAADLAAGAGLPQRARLFRTVAAAARPPAPAARPAPAAPLARAPPLEKA